MKTSAPTSSCDEPGSISPAAWMWDLERILTGEKDLRGSTMCDMVSKSLVHHYCNFVVICPAAQKNYMTCVSLDYSFDVFTLSINMTDRTFGSHLTSHWLVGI